MSQPIPGFLETLSATGPHPSLGDHADDYGRLIGSWFGDFRDIGSSGETTGSMEVHFGWVLEGRAVQDTWIAPGRSERSSPGYVSGARQTWGSTLRIFDPEAKLWRVTWLHPARQVRGELIGRRVGDDIVQFGFWDERPQRWCFRRVTPTAFDWEAHGLADDGETWVLQTAFKLRRA